MAEINTEGNDNAKTDIFKCKVCQMKFPDIDSYTEHIESKQHVKNIMKQKYGKKYLEAKEMLEAKRSNKNAAIVTSKNVEENSHESEEDSDSDEDDVYTCDICDKICTGLVNYKLHLSGNKHLKKVKQLKTVKELKENKLIPNGYRAPDSGLLGQFMKSAIFASSDLECEICRVKCTGPEVYKQHCKGEAHRKKEAKLKLKKEMEDKGMPANTSNDEFDETYKCEVCNKAFSGVLPYKQHLESSTHLKQERKNKSLEKIKDLCVTSPINSKLKCKECNKTFTGPVQFEDHLKSSSHGKLKKKSNLYEELEKNYPEMVKTTLKEDDDTDESDEELIKPACGICSMIFSGPEVALEHFESEKHKKALRKKKRIEKNKSAKKEQIKKKTLEKKRDRTTSNEDNSIEEINSDDSFERISS